MECYLGCPFSEGSWSSVSGLWLQRATGRTDSGGLSLPCQTDREIPDPGSSQREAARLLLGLRQESGRVQQHNHLLPSRSLDVYPEDLRLGSQACICHLISPRPEPRLGLTYVGCDLSQWSVTTRDVKYFVLCPV